MAPPKLIGNKEKAILHIAKAQLGMSEDDYRDMLRSVGVSSSKELNFRMFDELMKRLHAAGFRKAHKSAKKSGMHKPAAKEKEPMLSKISAILATLDLPWSYADGIARQMFGVEMLRWCDSEQTYKVLQCLIMWEKKQEKKGQGASHA